MSHDLKPEQKRAIEVRGKSVLVSASAGSGKTFVMIERVVSLLKEGASLENMLIVTFTDAAAQDMKLKLERRLNAEMQDKKLSKAMHEHMEEQLAVLPTANVSTFHSFCKKIITKYFYIAEIDSGFGVSDSLSTNKLAATAAENILTTAELSGGVEFATLAQAFAGKRNLTTLSQIIIKLHEFLQNQTDAQKFVELIKKAHSPDLDTNPACRELNSRCLAFAKSFVVKLNAARVLSEQAGFSALTTFIDMLLTQLSAITESKSFIKNRELIAGFDTGVLRLRAANEAEQAALDAVKLIKDSKDALGLPKQLGAIKRSLLVGIGVNEIKQDLSDALKLATTLVDFVFKFKDEFARLKRERNVLDYADLESFALKVLKHSDAQKEIEQEYDYIFVDEYQDTNNVQEEILSCVARENNLFVVGDVKQSIYGFRNTNPEIFVGKNELFRNEENENKLAIELNYNFRSDNSILQFVNFLFACLMTDNIGSVDYKTTGMFKTGQALNLSSTPSVQINLIKTSAKSDNEDDDEQKKQKKLADKVYSVRNAEIAQNAGREEARAEARVIASYIAERVGEENITDKDSGMARKLGYGDIVVLMRSQKDYAQAMLTELVSLGVPASMGSKTNLLDCYEVQLLHNFLQLLSNDLNDIAIATMCVSDIIGLTEDELASIRQKGTSKEFYEAVREYRLANKNETSKKLNKLYDLIYKYRKALISNKLYDVVSSFVKETELNSIMLSCAGGMAREHNINAYMEKLMRSEELSTLSSYLATIEANEGVLMAEEGDAGVTDSAFVRVETMHHSKGREFPVVILAGLGTEFNTEAREGNILLHNKLGLGLYSYDLDLRLKRETLARSGIKEALTRSDISEELRLLYVACTRAKNQLMLVGVVKVTSLISRPDAYSLRGLNSYLRLVLSVLKSGDIEAIKQGKRKLIINANKPCEFEMNAYSIGEFRESGDVKNSIKIHNLGVSSADTVSRLKAYCDYVYPHEAAANLAYKNTVTKLVAEHEQHGVLTLSAPRQFRLSESEDATGVETGNAYHHAMEEIDYSLRTKAEIEKYLSQKLSADELKLVDSGKIEKCLHSISDFISASDGYKLYREQRFYMLKPYNQIVKKVSISDKILVQGTIDLLVQNDDQLVLIDFKTTRARTEVELLDKYRIQLYAYKLAAESALNCAVTKIFIYSFCFDKLILFDI